MRVQSKLMRGAQGKKNRAQGAAPRAQGIINRTQGFTLIELIVSIFVLSIIMIAVTTVFAPILRTYERANNLAEANTLLDNISVLVMSDVNNAKSIVPGSPFVVTTAYDITYTSSDGILMRSALGLAPEPVLPKDFYKYKPGGGSAFAISAKCALDNGIVTVSLTLTADDGWTLTRDYTARPIGLAA